MKKRLLGALLAFMIVFTAFAAPVCAASMKLSAKDEGLWW